MKSNFLKALQPTYWLLLLFMASIPFKANADTGKTGIRDNLTGLEIAAEMAPGVNLWNTLDAHCAASQGLESETCWGNPVTNLKMITDIADRGFKTLRIPVTWYNHMGPAPDYKIDDEWMDRVEEVANYAFTNNLYVILNIHHDEFKPDTGRGWIRPTNDQKDSNIDQLEKVWTQIAERFKDYGDYLIFETINEPRAVGTPEEWNGGSQEHRDNVNAYNLAVVNTIRSTGGNNAKRFMMIPQVGAHGFAAVESLVFPNDDPRLLVSLHDYTPFFFTLSTGDASITEWGSQADKDQIESHLKAYHDAFVAKGRGVILGEWGAAVKDNLEDRLRYYNFVAETTKKYQITPITWIYSYQRSTGIWEQPEVEDAILKPFAPELFNGTPEVSFENIENGDVFLGGNPIEINATATDEDGTVSYVDLFINENLVRRDTTAPYQWSTTNPENDNLQGLAEGEYILSLEVTDNDGKKRKVSKSISIVIPAMIPGVVEAENFYSQSGIQAETTSDIGGGKNIGFIENSDSASYKINTSKTDSYILQARVATNDAGGTIKVLIDNIEKASITVDNQLSKGWQDWYTTPASASIDIEEGLHDLKLIFEGPAGALYNVNWISIQDARSLSNDDFMRIANEVSIYPTVTDHVVNISTRENTALKDCEVFDLKGTKQHLKVANDQSIDVSSLSNGFYFLRINTESGSIVKKIIKK